jgi:hypothetical protein
MVRLFIRILLILLLLGCLFLLAQKINVFPLHDFLEYWTAGNLNFNDGNPYSPTEMFSLQKQLGWDQPYPLMMFNPPWLLTVAMPFSMIAYPFSRFLWFIFELFILFIAADLLWKTFSGNPNQRWIAWLVVLSFGPTLQTLKLGQVSPFITLGLAGFLFFLDKEKPFWAGVMASFCSIKPQLLYLFFIALLFWIIKEKKWLVLLGIISGIFFSLLPAVLVNHKLILQYLYAIPNQQLTFWVTATIGSTLRLIFGEELFFLQFIPSLLGLAWLIYFWIKNAKVWNWKKHLPILILISIVTTSYGWAFDLSVLVVSIIPVVVIYLHSRLNFRTGMLIVAYGSASLLNTFLSMEQHWFWWLSSFFLVLYLLANHWLKNNNG